MLKRLYIYVLATVLLALPSFLAKADADSTRVVFAGDAFLKPLQKRDSVLIADQLKYGFRLDNVKAGTALALGRRVHRHCRHIQMKPLEEKRISLAVGQCSHDRNRRKVV